MAYHGVKFAVTYLSNDYQPYSRLDELISWCNIFALNNLAPTHPEGSYGNLSVRINSHDMLITATSLDLGKKMTKSDFVYVHQCDYRSYVITASGGQPPSSETPIHWALYAARPDVMAVFHGHNDAINASAAAMGIPETAIEQPYGSLQLVAEVEKLCDYDFFNMKNHGFISMGKTMEDAGNLAMQMII